VTLGRLVLAWLPVAVWFVLATYAIPLLVAAVSKPPGEPGRWGAVEVSLLKWRLVEAALLTLFASLWFDSLGSGGWWVLFLLVGAIAAGLPRRPARRAAFIDVGRYVVAGGILAWRLG
jgi:hypothetical protein